MFQVRRMWTEEEIAYLEKFYEKRSVGYIAKKLNRTMYSVKRKAQSLGHNVYVCEDLYVRTMARCFCCDSRVINRWIEKYGLPCTVVKRGQLTCKLVSVKDFWKWAEKHKNLPPWQKYERRSILPEPEWLKETIQKYAGHNYRQRITPYEIQTVIRMRKQGKKFEEISGVLNRSINSVRYIWRKHK